LSRTLDIVLPVYNEEPGIVAFNDSLFAVLRSLAGRYSFRVIYVLDRSRDRSFEVLSELSARFPEITVLHLSRRFGHQMSLVAGMDASSADALIMMDCDGQHPPSLIPELLDWFEVGYDIVYTIRRYASEIPVLKRVPSSLFYKLQNMLSPVNIPEGAADYRLISRKVLRVFQTSIREQEQFLRGLFQWAGYRSTAVEFVSPARYAGDTKYNIGRLLQFSVNGIVSFSRVPLRFATFLGGMISMLAVLYGFFLIGLVAFGYTMPAGYVSIVVLLLFLSGLQLMVLGVIGEYIGSIHAEVKRRPMYLIDEIVQGGVRAPDLPRM
jgi:polyisoprenyl-phosphate glycosyltransferase